MRAGGERRMPSPPARLILSTRLIVDRWRQERGFFIEQEKGRILSRIKNAGGYYEEQTVGMYYRSVLFLVNLPTEGLLVPNVKPDQLR